MLPTDNTTHGGRPIKGVSPSPYTPIFLTTYIHFSELVVRLMLKVPLEVNLLLPWQHLLDIWTYLKCLSITGKEFCTIFCFAFNTLVTKFFNHRADVDCVDDHGWTTMHETILGKSVEVAEYLNKIRPKMKFKACQQGRTSLHLAAFCDSPKALLRYIGGFQLEFVSISWVIDHMIC